MGEGFAPTDFDDWPSTRIAALVYDVILLIAFIVGYFRWRGKLRVAQQRTQALIPNDGQAPATSAQHFVPFYLFGFWPAGYDLADIRRGEDAVVVVRHRQTLLCCCWDRWTEPRQVELVRLHQIQRTRLEIQPVLQSAEFVGYFGLCFLLGCAIGLFVHFIPCLWWTCDWGPHDGAAIRGAIWFTVWGIVTTLLLCFLRRPALMFEVQDTNSGAMGDIGKTSIPAASHALGGVQRTVRIQGRVTELELLRGELCPSPV
jgi:hypothetical protein